jgi:hypothetical protein
MRRLFFSLAVVGLISAFVAAPQAAAQQSVNLYLGGFVPRGEDSRGTDDVLFQNGNFLSFDIGDFDGATAGGEWLVELGSHFEAGLGVGIYSRTVPSVYTRLVDTDGSEIEQDLKLRIVPFTATVRILPFGRHTGIEPYVGAGAGIFAWRYSESGQFVDVQDDSIFRDTFVGSGTSTGPVVLGGLRVSGGAVGIGGEIRYQAGKGDLPSDQGFAGSTVDLGGFNYLAVLNVRF